MVEAIGEVWLDSQGCMELPDFGRQAYPSVVSEAFGQSSF